MINKRFSTSKKASKITKRVLGMESLENRELLSINPLGYDGAEFVQTAPVVAEADVVLEAESVLSSTSTVSGEVVVDITGGDGATVGVTYKLWVQYGGTGAWTDTTKSVAEDGSGNVAATSLTYTSESLVAGQHKFMLAKDNGSVAPDMSDTYGNELTVTLADPAPTGPAVTNSVASTSGVTSGAATITWTKPTTYTGGTDPVAIKSAVGYTLTVTNKANPADTFTINAATLKTKTNWAVTGLTAGATYEYTVTSELTLKEGTSPTGQQMVARGEVEMESAGTAADVTVGAPTDVKVAYAAKTGIYKITWKAPANYTGGYTVTINDGTLDKVTETILPGAKLQLEVADSKLTANTIHSIVVAADAINYVESTPTFITVGTVTPAAAVPAADPTASGAALPDVSGGTTIAITAGSAGAGTVAAVGYYVGLAASATPTDAEKAAMFYVADSGGATTDVKLVGESGKYVVVYGVAADGTLSANAANVELDDTNTPNMTAAYGAADADAGAATKATAKADSATKNKVAVTWTAGNDVTKQAGETLASGDTKYEIQGYVVSYQVKGSGNWLSAGYVSGRTTVTATVENLAWATEYEFKVEAVVIKSTHDGSDWVAETAKKVSTAATASLKTAAAAKIAAPTKASTPFATTGLELTVNWTKPASTPSGYKITLLDANKSELYSTTVGDVATYTFTEALLGFNLTPKAKYTVQVSAFGSEPGTYSTPLAIAVTMPDYPLATVKDAKATTITSISVVVTAATKGVEANSQYYYVEYTEIVDAKGKPDWNAAEVISYTAAEAAGDFAAGDPKAFAAGATVKIEGLNPGTQYFVRVVAVDKVIAPNHSTTAVTWADVERVATSKEAKIKTVAVPLATIAKPGFAMDTDQFGFKFSGKDPNMNDSKTLLRTGTTFTYTLLVSEVATVNKATGKLNGAQKIDEGTFAMTIGPDAKGNANSMITSRVVTFSELVNDLNLNLENLKTLNFQLEVTYNDGTDDYAVTYSKVSKLTMPKWFV